MCVTVCWAASGLARQSTPIPAKRCAVIAQAGDPQRSASCVGYNCHTTSDVCYGYVFNTATSHADGKEWTYMGCIDTSDPVSCGDAIPASEEICLERFQYTSMMACLWGDALCEYQIGGKICSTY